MSGILTKDKLTSILTVKSTIEIKSEGRTLFRYCRDGSTIQICNQEQKKTVFESLARVTGLIDHRCEYYPYMLRPGQELKFDRLSFAGFREWFMKITANRTVALDTGVIVHHLMSRVVLPHLRTRDVESIFQFMQSLTIPRLAIIEIEDKYNRAKEKDRDRRLMIYALTEVQALKALGALISTFPLASSFLADFRRAEGGHHADAFIRREIMESRDPYLTVFVTRDLMNAMAASAEGMDSLYFAVADPDTSTISISSEQLVDAVIEAAITFSEIEIYDADAKSSIMLEGMWSGKTNIDWFESRLRIRS